MEPRAIDLIYFDGCPNAAAARANLRAALESRPRSSWREWELSSEETPERFRRYGSPTVLVDGRDVTGEEGDGGDGAAMACRAGGAPSVAAIREALDRSG